MFVGHYGPTLAIKAIRPGIRMWVLFIAVQFLDVVWSILVLLGIEKVRIVPGITASNPFDLYYMPYTHGLISAIVLAAVFAAAAKVNRFTRTLSGAVWLALAVFSHWVLDFVVHRPDLPLYDNTMKVGLGLWNYPAAALALEAVLLFAGMFVYMKTTKPVGGLGRFGMPIFGVVMLLVQVYVFFGPPPVSANAAAITAIVSYLAFAIGGHWLDAFRVPLS